MKRAGDEQSSETTGRATSMARIESDNMRPNPEQAADDKGSDQAEASNLLQRLKNEVFDGDNAKLALALGRPTDEVEAWATGAETTDSDVLLKARALASERGLEI